MSNLFIIVVIPSMYKIDSQTFKSRNAYAVLKIYSRWSVVKLVENHNWLIGRICCLLPTDDQPMIESVTNYIEVIKMGH